MTRTNHLGKLNPRVQRLRKIAADVLDAKVDIAVSKHQEQTSIDVRHLPVSVRKELSRHLNLKWFKTSLVGSVLHVSWRYV